MSSGHERELLQRLFAPEVVDALERLVDERVRGALESVSAAGSSRTWLTLEEAGRELGYSANAIRMRIGRGRLEARRQGRRVYVSAASIRSLSGGLKVRGDGGELLSVGEAAHYLRCAPQRIYELRSSGRLPRTSEGGRALVRRGDLEALIADPAPME